MQKYFKSCLIQVYYKVFEIERDVDKNDDLDILKGILKNFDTLWFEDEISSKRVFIHINRR